MLYELSDATFEESANGFEHFIGICQQNINHYPWPNKNMQGATISLSWTKPFQNQWYVKGFAINIFQIKLTNTKESTQNNEMTLSHY